MEKIFSGKTLEEAREAANDYLKEKGIDISDVKIEITEQPVKKLFGVKGEYKVRAVFDGEPAASETFDEAKIGTQKSDNITEKSSVADDSKYSGVKKYVSGILTALGASDFEIKVYETADVTTLDIVGENLGIVIGRRGETLDSLQYLAVLANNRHNDGFTRISIDCNGYREKRKETLETLARRTAEKVLKQGRRITLEPMNPYERRIIHSAVSDINGVFSNSIGDEPYRKVVISSNNPRGRSGGNDRRDKNSGNRDRSSQPVRSYKQSSGFSTSFEREYKRNTDIEISKDTVDVEKSTTLYGKIEL